MGSGNLGKLKEIQFYLKYFDLYSDYELLTTKNLNNLTDPVEDALTFQENAEIKSQHYFNLTGLTTISDDSGFIIDELDDDLRKIVSQSFVRRFFIFCSFFMATKDVFIALILTIVFVIIINEFLGKEEEEEGSEGKDDKKGASFNKQELDKTIQKLKTIQSTM